MSNSAAQESAQAITGVPLLDLKAQYAGLKDEIEPAIKTVCDSQWFVMGPNVIELEEQVARYSSAGFGIGVSSGTDALLVALMALDVGAGDEVITTPFTFFATGGVIARVGAQPVFCDIDPATYNLDPAKVRAFLENDCEKSGSKVINKKTGGHVKVVMPVHLFGQVADMAGFMDIAREYGLRVVEDAAQAIGSESAEGQRAGCIGDIGCFSFFPSKNLGAFGDGGMCVANDPELAERLRVMRLHGGKPKYYHALIGGNFRLDALQAAVLLVKLKYLDDWTEGRQRNAAFYDEAFAGLGDNLVRPHVVSGGRHIFNQYTIRVKDRDGLQAHLKERGIGNEIYYPVPLHEQQCFEYLGYQLGDCPESEAAARSVVSIPIYPELNTDQLQYVADAVIEFVGSGS